MCAVEKNSISESESPVSVFVPCYNHGPFVERCLRSIFEQTLAPKQLLVIDDGSTDDSKSVIERVLKDCPFPSEFISRENRGLCATLNQAIEHAETEFFAYLGSDDIWFPRFLKERVELLRASPNAVLAYGHAYLLDENDNVIDSTSDWKEVAYQTGDTLPMLLRFRGVPICSSVVYRRSALDRRPWNEQSKLEDYELYLQLAHDGEFAFDPRALSAWRMHGYNTSSDLTVMLDEVLASQTRVAKMAGWDADELAVIHKHTRFVFAELLTDRGHRATAAKLFVSNIRGEPLKKIARLGARLLVPPAALQWRRKFIHRRNAERFSLDQILRD